MRRTFFVTLAAVLAAAVTTLAAAQPTLVSGPYPTGANAPTSGSVALNGGAERTCTVINAATAPAISCDLAGALSSVGDYSALVYASNATGKSVASTPFVLTWRGNAIATPAMTLQNVGGVASLVSQVYPATGNRPDRMSASVNGGAPITCAANAAGAWVCPLTGVTAAASYSAVTTAQLDYRCTNPSANVGICNGAGSASSGPFAFELPTVPAAPSAIRVQ